jgi:hypothetical protein
MPHNHTVWHEQIENLFYFDNNKSWQHRKIETAVINM